MMDKVQNPNNPKVTISKVSSKPWPTEENGITDS